MRHDGRLAATSVASHGCSQVWEQFAYLCMTWLGMSRRVLRSPTLSSQRPDHRESLESCRSRSRSRRFSRPRPRPSKTLKELFSDPQVSESLRKFRHHLLDTEEESWQKLSRTQNDESISIIWRQQKSLIASEVKRMLSNLLKDLLEENPEIPCEPTEIARELGCCILQARSSNGRDIETQNKEYSLQNHKDMISDQVRADAFWDAIRRALAASDIGKVFRVLDVGSGAFCFLSRMALAAGAKEVHAVEVNRLAWQHALQILKAEADVYHRDRPSKLSARGSRYLKDCVDDEIEDIKESLQSSRFPLIGTECCDIHVEDFTLESKPSCRVSFSHLGESGERRKSILLTQHASSSATQGPYQLVIHELLGHIASSEGVAETIDDLLKRGVCSPDCAFIPRAAGTLFAPTATLQLTELEKVLNAHFNGKVGIQAQVKYHARCFDCDYLLAQPQPFEWLDFYKLQVAQKRRVTFVTERDGHFDGLHFHLLVELDELTSIDTLRTQTTWSTTYVRLVEDSLWLPSGTRIVCDCEANQKENGTNRTVRYFCVRVLIGEPWDEKEVASFAWDGCTWEKLCRTKA